MDPVRELIVEQRKRLVATLMHELEPKLRPTLGEREWKVTRGRILDAIGSYHDLVLDALKVGDRGTVRNEHAVQLIEAVHRGQQQLEVAVRDALNGRSG